ncbi:MAG: hypothetical protein ABI629_04320 [bacterium]
MSNENFRRALLATAVMNVVGFFALMPPFPFLRQLVGVPEAPPFYGWLLALWILFFGLAYLRLAYVRTPERLFLQIGAAGKASFALLLIVCWLAGDLPILAPLAGSPDLGFAALFAARVYATRDRAA